MNEEKREEARKATGKPKKKQKKEIFYALIKINTNKQGPGGDGGGSGERRKMREGKWETKKRVKKSVTTR